MIGNDIVDLRAAARESNWRRKGWLGKVCTPAEQAVILNAAEPEETVWLLWSMKEAAYKLYARDSGLPFFAPARFSCTIINADKGVARGLVQNGSFRCHTRSFITTDFIHTGAALQDNLRRATLRIYRAGVSHSSARHHIFFKDRAGIPFLLNSRTGKVRDVSYSHHGGLEALAFFA